MMNLFVNMLMIPLLLVTLMTVTHADHFEELSMENEIGINSFEENLLIFTCEQHNPMLPFVGNFSPSKNTVYPKKLTIRHCMLPNSSFAQSLQDLNINVSTIEFLKFVTTQIDPIPKGNYMEGLNLKTLLIDSLNASNIFENNPDFLKPLSNLTNLMVWGTQMPQLSENIHLEVLSIGHNAKIVGNWTNCKKLRMLSIYDEISTFFPRYWPEECQNLRKIRLRGLTKVATHQVMDSDISTSSVNLEVLYMQHCNITGPPYEILKNAKNLKHLILTRNIIIDKFIEIPFLANLTNLDLSYNFLLGTKLLDMAKQTPNLKYLNLDGNPLKQFNKYSCNETEISAFASSLTSLERLSLNKVTIFFDCFENVTFSKLKYLDVASYEVPYLNKTESINLRKLPMTDAPRLEVDLRGRRIKRVEFDSNDYVALLKEDYHYLWGPSQSHSRRHRSHLSVLLNITEYDCESYWFCLTLLKFPDLITCPDCKCPKSGISLKEEFQKFNCTVDYQGCFIINNEETDDISLQCNDDVESVDLQGLTEFTRVNFKNNRNSTLRLTNVPDSLEWLDLRGNNISVDNSDVAQIFKNPKTRILASNNSFICDCKIFEEVQKFKSQIESFDQIKCTSKSKPDEEIAPEELCKKTLYKSAFISVVCVIFALQITFLAWWYKDLLKRYIMRKGWCKRCFKYEVNDAVSWESVQPNRHASQEELVDN